MEFVIHSVADMDLRIPVCSSSITLQAIHSLCARHREPCAGLRCGAVASRPLLQLSACWKQCVSMRHTAVARRLCCGVGCSIAGLPLRSKQQRPWVRQQGWVERTDTRRDGVVHPTTQADSRILAEVGPHGAHLSACCGVRLHCLAYQALPGVSLAALTCHDRSRRTGTV